MNVERLVNYERSLEGKRRYSYDRMKAMERALEFVQAIKR